MLWLIVAVLGLLAGGLTTVAGLGGGMVLVAILAVTLDPVTALSATAIGLLIGNLHRVWMYRSELSWGTAFPMVVGAVPGAFAAGLVVAWLPGWSIFALMLAMGGLAVARASGWDRLAIPAWAGVPVGLATGVVTATSGGGGLLVAPWVLARGLVSGAYVGTVAIIAVSLHTARIAAYGWSGSTDGAVWALGLVLALSLPLGNLAGHALRERLALGAQQRVQLITIGVGVAIAGIGMFLDLSA